MENTEKKRVIHVSIKKASANYMKNYQLIRSFVPGDYDLIITPADTKLDMESVHPESKEFVIVNDSDVVVKDLCTEIYKFFNGDDMG